MSLIGNILWVILGGAVIGLGWWLAGLLAYIFIICIPWGKACFVIGQFAFFPFGKEAVSRNISITKTTLAPEPWVLLVM